MASANHHPMFLPGATTATARDSKFLGYLLRVDHPDPSARGKATLFRSFGWNESNWQDLRDQFLAAVPRTEARYSKPNRIGTGENWEVKVTLTAPNKRTLEVFTYWEVHPIRGTQFVTAYPS